jgi:hypothetical protein
MSAPETSMAAMELERRLHPIEADSAKPLVNLR